MKLSEGARSNRAFEEMRRAAVGWLAGKEPLEIARDAGIRYGAERGCFSFSSLGTAVQVSLPDYRIAPELDAWQQLVILHYMNLADGCPLTGRWKSMSGIRDGMIRGGDFDVRCERAIHERLSAIPANELEKRSLSLGGWRVESNADIALRFDFMPRYPLLLKLWYADEDLPASGKLLMDESADHYLQIEDAVTVGQLVMERLLGAI